MTKKQKKQLRRQRRLRKRALLKCESPTVTIVSEGEGVVLQAAGDEETSAKTFSMLAYSGGLMRVPVFPQPVVVEISGIQITEKSRPILRDHKISHIVGHTTSIEKTGGGLRVSGVISAANAHASEVIESSKNGFPWQSSIGAIPLKVKKIRSGETVQANGQTFQGPLVLVVESKLREVSFVGLGADDNTSATVAAADNSSEGETDMGFEVWLTAKGFDINELEDDQKQSLQAMYDTEHSAGEGGEGGSGETGDTTVNASGDASDNVVPDITAQMRTQAADELTRQNRIGEICAQYDNPTMTVNNEEQSIQAIAIREGWDESRTELESLRASRPQGPAMHSRNHDRDCTLEAMQGALMLRAGVALDHNAWQSPEAIAMDIPGWLRAGLNDEQRQRTMEFAHRYADMSLFDICAEAVRMDGGTVPSGRQKTIEAAFSGSTLTNIFTTNVNTRILATYNEAGDTTADWTSETDVPDFKSNERPRMTKGPDLKRLPPGGTADHVERSDIAESYKIARYAKQFTVDDQDIINDRFNALMDTPREMGLAAARLRPDLVYAILLANAALSDSVTLFHAASHGNLFTSAALAAATLEAAITGIETQQENSVNLNLRATHLLVPSDLKFTASQLINSSEMRDTTASTKLGTRNPIQDENLTLVSDARLSNGVTDPATETAHAGSATTWFLASALAHVIEVAYLRGTGRAPQVRRFNLDRGQWGIGWDVKMDIGAKALDYRGVNKNTA